MTECYVCYEPCKTLSPCLCKTLYVHDTCITILRMYGNTECGICKTAFDNSIPVDRVIDVPPPPPLPPRYDDSDSDEEDDELPAPPCLCYFICVPIRCDKYKVTETDLACDSLRVLISMFSSLVIIGLYSSTFVPDFFVFVVVSMFVLGCCNALSHKRSRRLRTRGR